MPNDALNIDIVRYIEMTQPQLEKMAEDRARLHDKVAEAVDYMISNRVLPPTQRDSVVTELTQYPEKIAELLIKISEKVGPVSLGETGDTLDGDGMDPILQFVLE